MRTTLKLQQILGFLWSTNQPFAHQRTQKKRKTFYLTMVFITSPRSFSSSDGDFVRPNVLNTKWVVRVRTEESSPGERWLCYNTIRLDMRPLYYVQPLSKILLVLGSRQASGLHEADINQRTPSSCKTTEFPPT